MEKPYAGMNGTRDYSQINAALARMVDLLKAGEFQSANECCDYVLRLLPGYGPAYLGKLMAEFSLQEPEDLYETDSVYTGSMNYKNALYYADPELKRFLRAAPYENYYLRAKKRMAEAEDEQDLKVAAGMFQQISGYRDADDLARLCVEKVESTRQISLYEKAESLYAEAADEKDWQAAADAYACLNGYKDSVEKRAACIEKAETLRKDRIYSDAPDPMDCSDVHELQAALEQYNSIYGWKDAGKKADQCRSLIHEMEKAESSRQRRNLLISTAILLAAAIACGLIFGIIPLSRYNHASDLMRNGAYREAASLFSDLHGFMDSETKALECRLALQENQYKSALQLFNEGKYKEAAAAFSALGTFRDSADKASEAEALAAEQEDLLLRSGELFVEFGHYEQDDDFVNGSEPIEWLVLSKDGDELLLISRYALDVRPFHNDPAEVVWEDSDLHEWLNNEFYNMAFSLNEQSRIRAAVPVSDADPSSGSAASEERVSLLDIEEAGRYFSDNEQRRTEPTAYAVAEGSEAEGGYVSWWLRSNGYDLHNAAYVYSDGSIHENGIYVFSTQDCVRPVIRITQ